MRLLQNKDRRRTSCDLRGRDTRAPGVLLHAGGDAGAPMSFIITAIFVLLLALPAFSQADADEEDMMILEPVVQGFVSDDFFYAVTVGEDVYIPVYQVTQAIGIYHRRDNGTERGYWSSQDRTFLIDVPNRSAAFDGRVIQIDAMDFWEYDGQYFFRTDFYEKLFPLQIGVNQRQMRLIIDSEETLPVTALAEMRRRQARGLRELTTASFREYTFDKRLWSEPVVDISLSHRLASHTGGVDGRRLLDKFDSYGINAAGIFAGLDTNVYVFGDSGRDRSPRARVSASRVFIGDQPNAINLSKLQIGDLSGVNNGGYFSRANTGRGIQASSFKDLVLSANKTIDITGPLLDGWEVELYMGGHLVGFRRRDEAGRYEFLAIPVSYGLNSFRLVFYGPYGEINTEEKRYYSGTSPVAAGEFGYNFAAFQPRRYLVETNEPSVSEETTPVVDVTGYYGVSDRFTAMAGMTTTPDAETPSLSRQYAMLGGQYIWQGVSLQYNAGYGFENQATGHYFEAQGDIYIGRLFSRYEYYGDLRSSASYRGTYLKDLFETRISGLLPGIKSPWFLSYSKTRGIDGRGSDSAGLRLSRNIKSYYISVDNSWRGNVGSGSRATNALSVNAYKTIRRLNTNLHAVFQTHPTAYYSELGARFDYRLNKYTYAGAHVTRHNRSFNSSRSDLNTLTLSGGRVFPFGGITLNARIDSDKNMSLMLNYNISVGRNPGRLGFTTSARGKLSDRGAVMVQAVDEEMQPVPGIRVSASGSGVPVFTNRNGEAIITDLPTYSKTVFFIDTETVPDISLVPEAERYRYVLRPGTILPVKMPFNRLGAIEGQVRYREKKGSPMGYTVQARNKDGEIIEETYTDFEGYFILDSVRFGVYDLVILLGGEIVHSGEIRLNDIVYAFRQPILVD